MDLPMRAGAWAVRLVPAAMAVVQLVLLEVTAWDKADTSDEPVYLTAAAQRWEHGKEFVSPVPIFAYGLMLGLFDSTVSTVSSGRRAAHEQAFFHSAPPELKHRRLFVARQATILAVLLGGVLLWLTARRFGQWTALVAYALWCFSPTQLAHGSLATLDAWLAAAVCLVMWAGMRFVERPSMPRLLLLAASCAVAVGCKAPGLGVVPVAVVIVAWRTWRSSQQRKTPPWRSLLLYVAAFSVSAVLVFWAICGFSYGQLYTPEGRPLIHAPCPVWIFGIFAQLDHGYGRGHGAATYFNGSFSANGWWWFYFVSLAFKITLVAQLVFVVRIASLIWMRRPPWSWRLEAALLAFPLLLLVAMSAGKTQLGIRYLLPAFPPMALWGAGLFRYRWRRPRLLASAAAASMTFSALIALLGVPHYLMFYNAWAGGPESGPHLLVEGSDWCQDKRRLAHWMQDNGVRRIFYSNCWPANATWSIPFDRPPCRPQPGVYALHASEVHRPFLNPPGCFDWLTIEEPDERLGYSIYIYRVDAQRLRRMAAKWRSGAARWVRTGRASQ